MTKLLKYSWVALLFLGLTVNAQKKWTVQECVDYAIGNSISIKQSNLNLNNSQVNYFQSRTGLLPTLNAQIPYGLSAGRILNQTTYKYEQGTQQYLNPSLNFQWTFFKGLQQKHIVIQNRTLIKAFKYDAEQSKNTVLLNVINYYLQVMNNQEQVEIAKIQVETSKQQVERTGKLVKAGSKPEFDLYDIKSQLANDELTLVNAQNNVRIAKLNLMQNMNLPYDFNFEVETVSLNDPEISNYEKNSNEIFEVAKSSQPNIKAADTRIESNQYAVRIAKGGLYPYLTLNANLNSQFSDRNKITVQGQQSGNVQPIGFVKGDTVYSLPQNFTPPSFQDYPLFHQLKDYFNKYVGLTLTIPIFNAWQTRTKISSAVITRKQSELTAQNTRVLLRQTIEQAYVDMVTAGQQYLAYKKQVESLELSYKGTESRYQVGLSTSIDLSLSKTNLGKAKANLVQAKYNYIFRNKILDFYQNKPLIF